MRRSGSPPPGGFAADLRVANQRGQIVRAAKCLGNIAKVGFDRDCGSRD